MRQIVIDADGCPVTRLTVSIAKEKNIPCTIVCDTSHVFDIPEAKVITVEKGADSADFRIVNLLKKGDIVIAGNKSSTGAGGTSHIFILTGKWSDAGNPYIWDNNSATRIRKGQSGKHTYSGSTKVIAVIRLK